MEYVVEEQSDKMDVDEKLVNSVNNMKRKLQNLD